jgi:hypothetical protein
MTTGQDIQQVVRAFNSGDANMISQQFAERVEICMDDQVKMFNKKDAVNHLNKWFNSIQPKSFSARHSGGKTGGIQYYIGLLKSQSGDFRVFVYFNSEKNNYKINEIRVNTL